MDTIDKIVAELQTAASVMRRDGELPDIRLLIASLDSWADRLAALPAPGEWLPIESAPKDRRILLGWPPGMYAAPRVEFGRWDDDRHAKKPRPYWTGERPNDATAYRKNQPTHWRPLPAAPLAAAQGES